MEPKLRAEKILRELHYDFRGFSIDHFIHWVGELKKRHIFSTPWNMPPGLFGAWLSDDVEPNEYIFYRDNATPMHQIHIQLHELAHFLFGHPTLRISRERLAASLRGQNELPFSELVRCRSTKRSEIETESEILASLIQEQVIRHSHLEQLTSGISSDRNIARYLQDLGMI